MSIPKGTGDNVATAMQTIDYAPGMRVIICDEEKYVRKDERNCDGAY